MATDSPPGRKSVKLTSSCLSCSSWLCMISKFFGKLQHFMWKHQHCRKVSQRVHCIRRNAISVSNLFIITELGSLIGNCNSWYSTVWKFSNFPTPLILREINFGWYLKVKNWHFNNFKGIEFWFFGKISHLKMPKVSKNKRLKLFKWSKWHLLGLQNNQNWFHVISEWLKYPDISTMWKSQLGCRGLYRPLISCVAQVWNTECNRNRNKKFGKVNRVHSL